MFDLSIIDRYIWRENSGHFFPKHITPTSNTLEEVETKSGSHS